ncbi:MAG: hypothetical protein ABIH23_31395 [bacterium]
MAYQLLICVVKDDDAVEEILTGFLELGIGGATVLTARGMAEIISSQISLFAGFRDVFKGGGTSRIILSAMPAEKISEAHHLIERLVQADTISGGGVSFAVPIAANLGLDRQAVTDD